MVQELPINHRVDEKGRDAFWLNDSLFTPRLCDAGSSLLSEYLKDNEEGKLGRRNVTRSISVFVENFRAREGEWLLMLYNPTGFRKVFKNMKHPPTMRVLRWLEREEYITAMKGNNHGRLKTASKIIPSRKLLKLLVDK